MQFGGGNSNAANALAMPLRSQGMQTDIPMSQAGNPETKVYFKVVHNDRVLHYKLSWQSPFIVLFSNLNVRADFVWHGIVLNESLTPQHYNMLPGEENTATLHVVRAEHRKTTFEEDLAINDANRALGLKLRLQEDRANLLQRENDVLQGQILALQRESAEINDVSSQKFEEERAKLEATRNENIRLNDEVSMLKAQLEELRAQNSRAAAMTTRSGSPGAGMRRANTSNSLLGRSGIPTSATTPQPAAAGRSVSEISATPSNASGMARTPTGSSRTNAAMKLRESEIANLKTELGAWQNSVSRRAGKATGGTPARRPDMFAQGESTPAASEQPSARRPVASNAGPAPPFGTSAPEPNPRPATVRCIVLNEHTNEQQVLSPLPAPAAESGEVLTVGDAINTLRREHGPLIPPMTALMVCVQRHESSEYDVVDISAARNLKTPLEGGDSLFLANMSE